MRSALIALGLLAPLAANAADVNIAGLSQYGPSSATGRAAEQVTSITQFSDVQPTDWAYQALSNLIERYGCVAGYPNGTYRGCLLYTSPSPRDGLLSRMPSSA